MMSDTGAAYAYSQGQGVHTIDEVNFKDKNSVLKAIRKTNPEKYKQMNSLLIGLNRTVEKNESYLHNSSVHAHEQSPAMIRFVLFVPNIIFCHAPALSGGGDQKTSSSSTSSHSRLSAY